MDPIDRAAVLDALNEQIGQCDRALSSFDISMKDEYAVKVEKASLVAFRETLEYMPSAEPEQRWIPCSEKLPEQDTEVLVTRRFLGIRHGLPPKTYVETASLIGSVWTSMSDEYKIAPSKHTDPVAWMPLPDPYREEGESQ